MLMSVVALDDAVALIAFGFAATIVKAMGSHGAISVTSILQPFYEVVISFLLGAAMAVIMTFFLRWFKKPSNRICVCLLYTSRCV